MLILFITEKNTRYLTTFMDGAATRHMVSRLPFLKARHLIVCGLFKYCDLILLPDRAAWIQKKLNIENNKNISYFFIGGVRHFQKLCFNDTYIKSRYSFSKTFHLDWIRTFKNVWGCFCEQCILNLNLSL